MIRIGSVIALTLAVVLAVPAWAEQSRPHRGSPDWERRIGNPGARGPGKEDAAPPNIKSEKERKLFEALDAGLRAYERRKFKRAIELLTPVAKSGEPEAQFILGQIYEKGLGTASDKEQAKRWYEPAAKQGDRRAQVRLSLLHAEFEAVVIVRAAHERLKYSASEQKVAFNWMLRAARQGDSFAQADIGRRYQWGCGTEINWQKAAYWLRKAAYQGNAYAQYWLSEMYFSGAGVTRDRILALKWAYLAKRNGNKHAEKDIRYYRARMTHDDIREAQSLAKNK
jgi:TPR repeat protein